MEKVDIYDENRNKTGKIKYRDTKKKIEFNDGEYVLVVGALLINSQGQVLISKRSMTKPRYPGYWEINGGCSRAGEESIDAIVRELKEEIGIEVNKKDGILIKTVKTDHLFKDIWTFRIDVNIEDLEFSDGEVAEAKWTSIDELIKYREDGKLIDSNKINKEDYKRCLELLKINI